MTNADVARRLMEIRQLMEFAGEPYFEFMAYEKAAAGVEQAPPLAGIIERGELEEVPGVGETIAERIREIVRTGTCAKLESLLKRYPASLLDLLEVPGVGMKTAHVLYDSLGIAGPDDLERAIAAGKLDDLPRMGRKTIENMKRGLLARRGRSHRWPIGAALPLAESIIARLREAAPVERIAYAGSLRRGEPTVGDIDLVCTSAKAKAVIEGFTALPEAEAVLSEGTTKASFWTTQGLQVDLRVVPAANWGNLLQHFTGSREHNVQFREMAVKRGLRVSENGILDVATGVNRTFETEEEVYAALDLPYIPPELRLGSGELDAARRGKLPKLIEQRNLRGDFHMHTTWSDGRNTLEAMIEACAAKGYAYHAISEHSWGRGSTYGMTPEKLRKQIAAIREMGEAHGIRTLCGVEVDILPDGTLDFEENLLRELDFVVASVHSALRIGREKMTARLIRAIEHPCVNVIGHPTGRSVPGGTAYEIDADAVFAAAARTGTALEMNGNPDRLDLPNQLARRAAELGAMISLDSDAHDAAQLDRISYAVVQARRAWLEAKNVLNTRKLDDVLDFVAQKRGPAKRKRAR
ncbi:MAG TPA: DNA polymerase/3'-5' exonuclease PolX [Candidatus Dormibacteraeota bacterium]|nr:DNA polymerase/3'-5' exonuclease PolX [Candidatus Dormibacteraeota bacterium]